MKFCPICMLRQALAGGGESSEDVSSEAEFEAFPSPPGQRFDHYQVATHADGRPVELGRGAMGVTYKAVDIELRRTVTLKVINERYLGDESAGLRFLREARAAASVRHPNVASVFHLGRSGTNYFYAMEFVDGETLAQFIKRCGRLEVQLALEIAAQVATGLAAVHKQKLVHRDIKPSNIMVSLEDAGAVTAKIIDLGLAKTAEKSNAGTVISTLGSFSGTPEYSSPEQFAGFGVDIRSDLYSLGVTLWEMVTGQIPFHGTGLELMYHHQRTPLPLDQLDKLPQPMIILLESLLAKDPEWRFQHPVDLLKGLPSIGAACKEARLITDQRFRSVSETNSTAEPIDIDRSA
jgi:serine/threonine protein kinase